MNPDSIFLVLLLLFRISNILYIVSYMLPTFNSPILPFFRTIYLYQAACCMGIFSRKCEYATVHTKFAHFLKYISISSDCLISVYYICSFPSSINPKPWNIHRELLIFLPISIKKSTLVFRCILSHCTLFITVWFLLL